MKNHILALSACLIVSSSVRAEENPHWKHYVPIIRQTIYKDYKLMFREKGDGLDYPFIVPGSAAYADQLWDWDSWLSNIALRQILLEAGNDKDRTAAMAHEQGCVLNFLNGVSWDGWIPDHVSRGKPRRPPKDIYAVNMHKPVLAQHAAFLTRLAQGNAEWLREQFPAMQAFVNNYRGHHRHAATGLFFWQNDWAIGVDNDPATFARPLRSSGSIYLNCLMFQELRAMAYLAGRLNLADIAGEYDGAAAELKTAIQKHCWDERDGFYYSVDLNLVPMGEKPSSPGSDFVFHAGAPRNWDCLIQRIESWPGFMPLWCGIATPEQAKRIVVEHFKNPKTFNAAYGVRSLSKMEKMYSLRASGNPSNWLGPVWGVSNYMVWRGLVKYGFDDEARELATKTIVLFGRDFERAGALHEYYDPENGEPIVNRGFQNWNYLVLNMCAWMEGKPVVEEF